MDIQKQQAFEAHFKTTEIYRRECAIRGKDILEFSRTMNGYFNIIANEAWQLWQAAKAIPEGFVLMPIQPTEEMIKNATCEFYDLDIDDIDDRIVFSHQAMIEAQEQSHD